jgi:hypothetical protein
MSISTIIGIMGLSIIATIGGICSRKPKDESSDDILETYVPAVEEPRAELKELPIETIEGIGPKYGSLLREAGIETVAELMISLPARVAEICSVDEAHAQRWVAMSRFCWLDSISEEDAEAIVYGGGILGLDELAESNPSELLEEIKNAVLRDLVQIPKGYTFTLDMVKSWIDEAKSLTE